jgi:NAD:arginine ADP-ribosyltransferase
MICTAIGNRLGDVVLEDFETRGPIPGLAGQPLVSLQEAFANVNLQDKETYLNTAKYSIFGDHRLSDDEARAIYLYSCEWKPREQSIYFRVNDALRDRDRSKVDPFLPYIKLLNTAVAKVLIRVTRTLWRGVALDLTDMYKNKLGKTIIFWGFTSATTDMSALDTFIPLTAPHRTLFAITAKFAADLKDFSAYSQEAEILIGAGTVLKVMNVKRMAANLTIVELSEEANLLGIVPPS